MCLRRRLTARKECLPKPLPNQRKENHMKEPGTRLALQTVLLLVLFGFAPPLRAHVLDVCNNGTVSVVVVTAMKNADLARGLGKYYWAITSTAVPPGKGKSVYSDMAGEGAYLGFGFEDAKGQWGSRQSR